MMINKILGPAVAGAILLFGSSFVASAQDTPNSRKDNLTKHVYYLASEELKGRKAGSEEAKEAREYIIGQFYEAGLVPFFNEGFRQHFKVGDRAFCNAVGMIEGSDPVLKNEYVVLGAHYDHLGVRNGNIYPGADDNASGTAALIEVARVLSQKRDMLKRSVIFAAFDAEEIGLFGSNHLSKTLVDSLGVKNIKLMMSLDMVGYYRQSGELILQGTSTIKDGKLITTEEATRVGINVKAKPFENSIFTATDTEGFATKGVATLAVTTGLKSPYHKPQDIADSIDFAGLDKVSEYIGEFTVVACDPYLQPSGKLASKHQDRKQLEIGVNLGAGNGYMDFKDGGFSTNGGSAFSVGINAQYMVKDWFGVRASALCERMSTSLPVTESLYFDSIRYAQTQFTIPVLAIARMAEGNLALYGGIGAYWSYALDSGIVGKSELAQHAVLPGDIRKNQLGFAAEIGFNMGHVHIALEGRRQFGSLFKGPDAPRAQIGACLFKVGYTF